MFWGELRLKRELPKLVSNGYDERRLEKASYRLRVGAEVYVSPTGEPSDPRNKPKKRLEEDEGFVIPAGQFGFLSTEEKVHVPACVLAFISIRTKYKFRGLVNVSGFHVDPGFNGRLLFSVFNAGPGPVHLQRGEECFIIFFADLIEFGPEERKESRYDTLPSELTGPLANGLQSLANFDARVSTLEREQAIIKWATALIVGAVISYALSNYTSSHQERGAGEANRISGRPPVTAASVPPPHASPGSAPEQRK